MPYNHEIHHRRSIRLKGYDYSQEGLYFITICIEDRKYLLGEIVIGASTQGCPDNETYGCPESGINGCKQMILNDAGKMIERWYRELENKYPDKRCHEMVIMPNHFHCIIENIDTSIVRATPCGCPNELDDNIELDARIGAPLRGRPQNNDSIYGSHNKKYNATIGDLVNWFKTMTTNEYIRGVKQFGWKQFNGKLWQRNYYEHIIRSADEYERIADYIIDNPIKWHEDKFFR